MMRLMQSLRKKGSLFLLPVGIFMLAVSISSSAELITPACDGLSCANNQPCGTKCLCNQNFPATCVDNTPAQ